MSKVHDLAGAYIEAGDEIAYAINRGGSSPVLATYKVLEIQEDGRIKAKQTRCGHRGGNASDRTSTLKFPEDRAIITKKWAEV